MRITLVLLLLEVGAYSYFRMMSGTRLIVSMLNLISLHQVPLVTSSKGDNIDRWAQPNQDDDQMLYYRRSPMSGKQR